MFSEETISSRDCDYSTSIQRALILVENRHPTRARPLMHSAVVTQHLRQPASSSTVGCQRALSNTLGRRSLMAAVTRHQAFFFTLCNIPLEYKDTDIPERGGGALNGFLLPLPRPSTHASASAGIRPHLALVWMWRANRNCCCRRNAASLAKFGIDCSCEKRETKISLAFSQEHQGTRGGKKCDKFPRDRLGTQYEHIFGNCEDTKSIPIQPFIHCNENALFVLASLAFCGS